MACAGLAESHPAPGRPRLQRWHPGIRSRPVGGRRPGARGSADGAFPKDGHPCRGRTPFHAECQRASGAGRTGRGASCDGNGIDRGSGAAPIDLRDFAEHRSRVSSRWGRASHGDQGRGSFRAVVAHDSRHPRHRRDSRRYGGRRGVGIAAHGFSTGTTRVRGSSSKARTTSPATKEASAASCSSSCRPAISRRSAYRSCRVEPSKRPISTIRRPVQS